MWIYFLFLKKTWVQIVFLLLYFRQEVSGGGAKRSKAGANREGGGAVKGGVRDQPGFCWEAKQTHLLQTVAGRLHWARSGRNKDMLS